MKKFLIICIALAAVMFSFSGCSANDRVVKVGTAVHGVAKAAYPLGKGLLSDKAKDKLEATSGHLDNYGEKRKVVKDLLNEKKPVADTSPVLDQ